MSPENGFFMEITPAADKLRSTLRQHFRSKIWDDAVEWSSRNDVLQTLIDLINSLHLYDFKKSPGLGTVLKLLADNDCHDILEHWSIGNQVCEQLFEFSRLLRSDHSLLNKYEPLLSDPKSLDAYFTGIRVQMSVLSMLVRISHYPERNAWIIKVLSLWILAQCIERTQRGCNLDANIILAARAIRYSSETQTISKEIISLLDRGEDAEHVYDVISMDRFIRRSILKTDTSRLSPTEVSYLNAFRAVASGITVPTKSNSKNSPLIFDPAGSLSSLKEITTPPPPVNPDASNGLLDHIQKSPSDDDSSGGQFVSIVDPTDSYTQQRLSAKSIWFLSKEELAFYPWSWNCLTSYEYQLLLDWMDRSIGSNPELIYIVWVAIHCGLSIERAADLEFSEKSSRTWRISVQDQRLHRLPPSVSNAWQAPSGLSQWIKPVAERNEIIIPSPFIDIAKRLLESHAQSDLSQIGPLTIGECWSIDQTQSPSKVFNKAMTGPMRRIKSSMLGSVLFHHVFNETNNANCARMAAFHPQNGLPGAFAYGRWTLDQTSRLLNPTISNHLDHQDDHVTGMGSQLAPVESSIRQVIKESYRLVESLRDRDDPIAFHNAYVAYLVSALMVATGIRDIRDPFESPNHFDLQTGFVFINDKASSGKNLGRIIPLPPSLTHHLEHEYTKHLKKLAHALKHHEPKQNKEKKLYVQIGHHLNRKPALIPYFFFLNPKNLDWKSVSVTEIRKFGLFDIPLPTNLFRHRFTQAYSQAGIDQEIIDAWMDHADMDMNTYGDDSIRSWLQDFHAVKPLFGATFDSLGFDFPTTWTEPPDFSQYSAIDFTKRSFGIQLRKNNRQHSIKKAVKAARSDFDTFLGDRELENLPEKEIQNFMLKLTTKNLGEPQSWSEVRYRVFMHKVRNIWKTKAKKVPIRSIHSFIPVDTPFFDDQIALSSNLYQQLCLRWNDIKSRRKKSRRNKNIPEWHGLNYADSWMEIILALVLENRITYKRLISDVAFGQHCRLVYFLQSLFFEYEENLDPKNLKTAVQRQRISDRTTYLMDRILKKRQAFGAKDAVSEQYRPIFTLVGIKNASPKIIDLDAFIPRLCKIVDRYNRLTLPGVLAAYLSGRVKSCALNWNDWVRLTTNNTLTLNASIDEDGERDEMETLSNYLDSLSSKLHRRNPRVTEKKSLAINAKNFYARVRKEIADYTGTKESGKTVSRRIQKMIREESGQVSSSIILTAQWLIHLLLTGQTGEKFKPYAKNTIIRYMAAIVPIFQEIAYHLDIFALDEESITDLYKDFIEAVETHQSTFSADRLIDFHKFGESKGVEIPIWSDLDLPTKHRMVSPGILTESDFLSALESLTNSEPITQHKLVLAFILILCFRFGLRFSEAAHIRRFEICFENNTDWYLYVENHRGRGLKTKPSRRKVPLLFDLSALEKRIIQLHLTQFDLKFDPERGLFAIGDNKLVTNPDLLSRQLRGLLKIITKNPRTTLHHARHSFANATSMCNYNVDIDHWTKSFNTDKVKLGLKSLGKHFGVSRRNSVGVARLLGHTSSKVDARNYHHYYGEWADQFTGITSEPEPNDIPSSVICIDDRINKDENNIEFDRTIEPNFIEQPAPPTLSRTFGCLLLAGSNKPFKTAGSALRLAPEFTELYESLVTELGARMWLSSKQGYQPKIGEVPLEFLERITVSGQKRLYHFVCQLCDRKPPPKHALPLEELPYSLGMKRNVILTDEKHFEYTRQFIEYFEIPSDCYELVIPFRDNRLIKFAKKFGFRVMDSAAQYDAAYFQEERDVNLVRKRAVVKFLRNDHFHIHNSLEFAAVWVAAYVSWSESSLAFGD